MGRWASERGITAPLAAAALLAIFGAGALSVDAGNLWQNRRNLVTSTDSAVLREAGILAFNPSATCSGAWQAMLDTNAGTDWYADSGEGCIVHAYGDTGYVTVDAHQPSASFFSGVLGIGDGAVYSMSGAMWGYPLAGKGLRPMGLCWENHHVQEWLDKEAGIISPAQYQALRNSSSDHPIVNGSTGVLHKIFFTKDSPDQCGDEAPGNWGWIDFNGGANSNQQTQSWVRWGYGGSVAVGDCYADGTDEPCEGDTGSSGGSVGQELKYLKDNAIEFHIPIYGEVDGNGANAEFEMKGFLGVRLWDYKITGAQSSHYFTYEFRNILIDGPCCGLYPDTDGPDTGVRAVRLCTVDHDPQAAADRCTAS